MEKNKFNSRSIFICWMLVVVVVIATAIYHEVAATRRQNDTQIKLLQTIIQQQNQQISLLQEQIDLKK